VKLLLSLISLSLLVSCSVRSYSDNPITPIQLIDNIQEVTANKNKPFIHQPQQDNYSICHNHSCAKFAYVSLSTQQWQSVEDLFTPLASTAKQEREQIKSAIALLETMTGLQAGTNNDLAKNKLRFGTNGQLDCLDEATNTTVYLRLLFNADLVKMHLQASRTSRGGLLKPHNTATILETNSNTRYAVDSWFFANGEPPVIIPLSIWKSGWKPENN
jgi:hypothetical protein